MIRKHRFHWFLRLLGLCIAAVEADDTRPRRPPRPARKYRWVVSADTTTGADSLGRSKGYLPDNRATSGTDVAPVVPSSAPLIALHFREPKWLDRAPRRSARRPSRSNLRYPGCRRPIRRAHLVSFQCCYGSVIGSRMKPACTKSSVARTRQTRGRTCTSDAVGERRRTNLSHEPPNSNSDNEQ